MPEEQNSTNQTSDNQQSGNTQTGTGEKPASWEEYLAKQPEEIRALHEANIKGLKSALDSERQEKSTLAKQIKELSAKQEKGSEAQKALDELTGKLEAAEKRATFAEEAIKPEIGCSNPKAAWLIAVADNLFDRRGNPDWAAIKNAAPELFKQKQNPPGDAGNGTQSPPGKNDMNNMIRQKAGRT